MNLHGIASGVIAAVNPFVPVTYWVSTGYEIADTGRQVPGYATPNAFTASFAIGVMTVTAVTAGKLSSPQSIAGSGIPTFAQIVRQLSGTDGGIGTYQVSFIDTLTARAVTGALVLQSQLQPLTFQDLMHLDGMNIQGSQRALYVQGAFNGVVRPTQKGGDLVTLPDGKIWLTTHVLEQWPDWCKFAVTLQND
jgi:hypothetical protein